jgi:hypothetical protein
VNVDVEVDVDININMDVVITNFCEITKTLHFAELAVALAFKKLK